MERRNLGFALNHLWGKAASLIHRKSVKTVQQEKINDPLLDGVESMNRKKVE